MRHFGVLLAVLMAAQAVPAQYAPNRYALLMEDPPVAARYASRGLAMTDTAAGYRQQIQARQEALRAGLAARRVQVTGSASTLMNAVFVAAPEGRVPELRSLPGVTAVVPVRTYRLRLNRAADLVRAPAAWSVLGGTSASGAGLKIAILDTGVDHTHPAFQDETLPMPPGYPLCTAGDCAFTNNKVIVARSYVRQLAAGTSPLDPSADSRPDDYSARDREGHGTAVAAIAAGVRSPGVVAAAGVAPRAYLGSYKIYGSPGVNEFTSDDVIIQALEDAVRDGMDIVSFSTGGPAFTGPLDTGAACGLPPGAPCDLSAAAFEQAARLGAIIVAAAGNEGNDGIVETSPAFHTIASPAHAPSVIAVGASTNSHVFYETVSVLAPEAPAGLRSIEAYFGDAYSPAGAVAAPLRDVSRWDESGRACGALPAGSLGGTYALIMRGECTFQVKATNAVAAGAAGIIFYMADSAPLISPGGLSTFDIPVVMISNANGLALRSYLAANPDALVAMDPNGEEVPYQGFDRIAGFSSLGPSTGGFLVKPDLVAPGTYIYTAAQSYDPLGMMYSATRHLAASGTSFATPMVSGVAALVRQRYPNLTAAQVRSVLANTASDEVRMGSSGNPVTAQWVGAGKLNAEAAVKAAVTASPASVPFGVLRTGTLPLARELIITNISQAPVTLTVSVAGEVAPLGTSVTVDKPGLALPAGASGTLTVTLSGALPPAGAYSGVVKLEGSGVSVRVPYVFYVAGGGAANLIPLATGGFDRTVGKRVFLALRAVDGSGVPVAGVPVTWTALGGGRIADSEPVTNGFGVAAAEAVLRPTPGNGSFIASVGTLTMSFSGFARAAPAIAAGGVVNAASFQQGEPVAPGAYAAIFGSGLSEATKVNSAALLPMAIGSVNVSFDVPSAGISVPGRMVFASPGQVKVQVPWELQGQASARVKVTIEGSYGNVVTVPLADYAPAFFETGGGVAAALDAGNRVISADNRASRGQVIQLFANGLGPVTNQPASGEPARAVPLSETTARPTVTIGGLDARVEWSGLTPTLHGLYQVNVTVPADLDPGTHPVIVRIGGKTSKPSSLPVR